MVEGRGGNRNNSDTAASSFAVSVPAIALAKGGGAIRGIGEKFAANPVTGTGSIRYLVECCSVSNRACRPT